MLVIQIKYALENDVAFMGTGGGHGYTTTTSSLENGVNVDLGAFDSISIDTSASTMTIGGAVTFGDILDPVHAAGKEIRPYPLQYLPKRKLTNESSRDRILFLCRHGWCYSGWRHWPLPRASWSYH